MSLICLTWCISTSSEIPHITHAAPNLDFVNLAFQTLSILFPPPLPEGGEGILFKGSNIIPPTLAILVALVYEMSIKETLLSLSTLYPRSFPNFPKVLASVLSLNFLAKVKAHDSFTNHPILEIEILFLAKL